MNPPTCLDETMCKCNHNIHKKDAQNEQYCDDCYKNILKYDSKCTSCGVDAKKERLYINPTFNVPKCIKCYSKPAFPSTNSLTDLITSGRSCPCIGLVQDPIYTDGYECFY